MLQLVPLVLSLASAAAVGALVRRRGAAPVTLRLLLAALLLGSEAVALLFPVATGTWSPATALPLQLSDAATVLLVVALVRSSCSYWTRLGYLWGVAAGLLGLAFPAIGAVSPSPLYFSFYVQHGAMLVAAVALAASGSLYLDLGSVLRAWAATGGLAALAAVADLATGGDYMFLRQPPGTWSPLLLMGSWPWYVLAAAVLCPIVLLLEAAPLARRRPPGMRWTRHIVPARSPYRSTGLPPP
ncbi:MAG: TIGR02206 family membrane protein [Candidatus Dormibacteria bacterium]